MSPTRATLPGGTRSEQLLLLGLLLVSAAVLAALFLVSVHTPDGRAADEHVRVWTVRELAGLQPVGAFLRSTFPLVLAATSVVLAVVALVHRRVAPVVAASSVVAVSVVLARLLRERLPRPPGGTPLDGDAVVNTFPSGHVAASASLLVAVLLLWPRRPVPRTALVLAAVVLLATALGSVVTHTHRPSDVVGSVLLVAAVSSAAVLVARAAAARGRSRPP
ncbi:phosphatase PAP2 family protein [Isoptericola haloaureus]|uniref:Phosphatase PAP2 family protein n=1 Tax=Isoptericola haloaureus TaxID=1542902 RepID=A0ABU7Z4S4_9MICO